MKIVWMQKGSSRKHAAANTIRSSTAAAALALGDPSSTIATPTSLRSKQTKLGIFSGFTLQSFLSAASTSFAWSSSALALCVVCVCVCVCVCVVQVQREEGDYKQSQDLHLRFTRVLFSRKSGILTYRGCGTPEAEFCHLPHSDCSKGFAPVDFGRHVHFLGPDDPPLRSIHQEKSILLYTIQR